VSLREGGRVRMCSVSRLVGVALGGVLGRVGYDISSSCTLGVGPRRAGVGVVAKGMEDDVACLYVLELLLELEVVVIF